MGIPISVVIPTYNRSHCIERSIISVLNQTYQNFEVIVVDDGSTDNTENIVKNICTADNRVQYIKKDNGGAADARNYGVILAKNDFIAFQDSDDIWLPTKLEKQVNYLEKHPDTLFCYHRIRYPIDENKAFIIPEDKTDPIECSGNIFAKLLYDNLIGCPALVVNKELFTSVGGFDISLKALEDYDLVLRLAKNHLAGYVNEVLLEANFSEESVSYNPINFLLASCMIVGKHLKDYIKTDNLNHRISLIYNTAKSAGIEDLIMSYLEKQIQLGGSS